MGNRFSKNKVIPINLITLEKETKKLKKLCSTLEEQIKILRKESKFECCVCYDNKEENQKNIRCQHQICKRCYKLISDNKCPLCRKKMSIYLISYNR